MIIVPTLLLFVLVDSIIAVPLPHREVNEEDPQKFLQPTKEAPKIDPKRADSAEWMKIAEEDMKKADEMFGRPAVPSILPTRQSPVDSTLTDHKSSMAISSSSPSLENAQQQLPLGDPVEQADPNHLPAVPLEGDGALNVGYKAELLLGPEHFSAHNSPEEQRELLRAIFTRIDGNSDGFVDVGELTNWFLSNVRRHMSAAQAEGEQEFKRLDVNKDSKLEWHEYESAHLRAVLAAANDIASPSKASSFVNVAHGESEGVGSRNKTGGHDDHLTALRLRFMRADENGDDKLTLSEFSSFHHPEQHPQQLDALAKQLLASFDLDRDGKIQAWEFEAHTDPLPEEVRVKGPGSVMQYTKNLLDERRHQFSLSDTNADGWLSFEEIYQFLDPQNVQHAKHEAEDVLHMADVDGDSKLTLAEMLERAGELMGPTHRLCDPAEALHDLDEL